LFSWCRSVSFRPVFFKSVGTGVKQIKQIVHPLFHYAGRDF
jgi:hypothetical protein